MNETTLTKKVIVAIRSRGYWAMKAGAGPYQQPGIPDVLACVNGRFVGIEMKVGRNTPSPIQKLTLDQMALAGAVTGVAYTLEEALAIVDEAEAAV